MFKSSKLTRIGAQNLYGAISNYLDYNKYHIDKELYIKRLDYLYGWLYSNGVLLDEVVFNIIDIEKTLFMIFDSEVLLTEYSNSEHLFNEFEEISFVLANLYQLKNEPIQISEYMLEYFENLMVIIGSENRKRNKELIENIKRDLLYSQGLCEHRSFR